MAAPDVPVPRVRMCRDDSQRHDEPLLCGVRGNADVIPIGRGVTYVAVGGGRQHDSFAVVPCDARRREGDGRRAVPPHRLAEHVPGWHLGQLLAYQIDEIRARDNPHPLWGSQRQHPLVRIDEHRTLGEERLKLLRPASARDGPEAGADPTRHDHDIDRSCGRHVFTLQGC